MHAAAAHYIDAIDPRRRHLYDRAHGLILHRYPAVDVGFSYGMPTYRVDGRSLIVGVWKHGLSFYGLGVGAAADLVRRHGLTTSKGTVRVRDRDAAAMTDDELTSLADLALAKPAV